MHYRNITRNPHVAVHIGDGQEAIIVEGAMEIKKPTEQMAVRLADESFAKYPQYGRLEPSLYMGGVSVLRPRRVLDRRTEVARLRDAGVSFRKDVVTGPGSSQICWRIPRATSSSYSYPPAPDRCVPESDSPSTGPR